MIESTAQDTSALTLDMVEFLRSPEAQTALDRLQTESGDVSAPAHTLRILTELRKQYSAKQAAVLVSLAQLRQKAKRKFPHADQMFFSGEALEQATAWEVALHRAAQIDAAAPAGPLLDLGCGIGGDTLALAQFRPVIAFERDPLRLRLAQANAAALQIEDKIEFHCVDWLALMVSKQLPQAAAAFVDPARRYQGKRIFSLTEIDPPLATLLQLQQSVPLLAVKVMPGVQDRELPAGCAVEFVSHEGVCKEAVLWLGEWAWRENAEGGMRRASVYSGKGWMRIAGSGRAAGVGALRAGQFLYEPDPAVIRAGALAELGEMLDAQLFDGQIAYLLSDVERAGGPLYSSFQIDEIHRFSLKLLNQRLQTLQIGQVELKKRGFPEEPEHLRSRLKLTAGGRAAVVFFTRRGDERLMLIGRRLARQGDGHD